MPEQFRVGVSADFNTKAAGLIDPVVHARLDPLPMIAWEFMPGPTEVATAAQIARYDGILSLSLRYPADALAGAKRLAVLARWGVGYDMIDVPACTANDVLLAITPDGIRRPVAEGIVTLLLAITKQVRMKDLLVRRGQWERKTDYQGVGLTGRTLGSVGIGSIGSDLFRLLQPFNLARFLAYDPYAKPEHVAALGVTLVDLPTLLAESDFVCVNCPLTAETHHLIGEAEFARMKPTAFFVNTARGPIVDQAALTRVLQAGRIAGAALDVFEEEPMPLPDPLTELDNVILAPHAVAWTDQSAEGNGNEAIDHILTVLRGDVPGPVVNRDVIARPGFTAKLAANAARWRAWEGN